MRKCWKGEGEMLKGQSKEWKCLEAEMHKEIQEIKESRHIAERDRKRRRNVGEVCTNVRKESRDIVERDRRRRSRNVGESRKMQEKKAGIIVLKETGGRVELWKCRQRNQGIYC